MRTGVHEDEEENARVEESWQEWIICHKKSEERGHLLHKHRVKGQ